MFDDVLTLAQALIERASVTPEDHGCQQLLGARLAGAGFALEPMRFGQVDNLWARRGNGKPLVVFAGHTDVVPAGSAALWTTEPYRPSIRDGYLYGRGAADMKGGLAAMLVAAERFVAAHPTHVGSISFLLTSDEEGPAVDGTARVVETLAARQERIDYCVIGEASSEQRIGDTVRIGRRGSLNGFLTVHGVQGHVAYSTAADNPIHAALPALCELASMQWDAGDENFPPTSFQISNFTAGVGADNVIPDEAQVQFNIRYSTALTAAEIKEKTRTIFDSYGLNYGISWQHCGAPFLTQNGELVRAVRDAVQAVCGIKPTLSTGGGTSDGRFVAPTGAQVVELGPVNATIHKIDERVAVADIETLAAIYMRLLETLLV